MPYSILRVDEAELKVLAGGLYRSQTHPRGTILVPDNSHYPSLCLAVEVLE